MYTPMVYNVTLLCVNRRDVYVVNFQWYVDWAIPHPYPLVQELQHLPFLPSEVLPLFLYLGDRRHAYNAAMNYDLKIHAHVNMGGELHSAFPGAIAELHIDVEDSAGSNLLERFEEICKFLGQLNLNWPTVIIISLEVQYCRWVNKEALGVGSPHLKQCNDSLFPYDSIFMWGIGLVGYMGH